MTFSFSEKLITVVLFLLLISCNNNSKYSKKTDYFSNYLKKTFDKEIPDTKTFFFILPNSCPGCVKSIQESLERFATNENIIAITSYAGATPKNFPSERYWRDTGRALDKLNLGLGGTGLIITEKKEITGIIALSPENLDSVLTIVR